MDGNFERLMAKTKAWKIAANAKYDAKNTVQVHLKLNLNTDGDILARLDEVSEYGGGKQGYIKALIRQDIMRKGGKQ